MPLTKDVVLRQVKGLTFVAKADSGHWVVMDGKPEFGGSSAGSTPKELLLIALAGCTSNDVVSILAKKRAPVVDFAVSVHAEEREVHPRIFTSVHVEYVIYGESVKKEDVERAIELSTTKYCSVSAIVGASVKISHSYRIEPAPSS